MNPQEVRLHNQLFSVEAAIHGIYIIFIFAYYFILVVSLSVAAAGSLLLWHYVPSRLPSWDYQAADRLAAEWIRQVQNDGSLRICIYCRETGKDEQVAYLAMKRLARAIRAGECAGLRTLSVDLCDCEVVDDVRCFVYGSMDAFPPTIVYSRGRLWNSFLRNRYGAGRNMQSLLVSALACGGCPNLVSLELLPCRCDEESALAFASAVGSDPPRLGNLLQMTQEKASGDTKTRGLKLNEHLSILRLPRDFANSSNEEILACVRRRRRTRMVEDIFSTELSRDVSRCVASYGT